MERMKKQMEADAAEDMGEISALRAKALALAAKTQNAAHFAALVQAVPSRGRTAISYLTLYGAYASTVFWVIGHYLNTAYG